MLAEKAQTLVENNGKFPDAFVVPMDESDEFLQALGRRVHTSLAVSDPHTQAYMARLADEPYLINCLERAYHY